MFFIVVLKVKTHTGGRPLCAPRPPVAPRDRDVPSMSSARFRKRQKLKLFVYYIKGKKKKQVFSLFEHFFLFIEFELKK